MPKNQYSRATKCQSYQSDHFKDDWFDNPILNATRDTLNLNIYDLAGHCINCERLRFLFIY
jgi:hypothetical protein